MKWKVKNRNNDSVRRLMGVWGSINMDRIAVNVMPPVNADERKQLTPSDLDDSLVDEYLIRHDDPSGVVPTTVAETLMVSAPIFNLAKNYLCSGERWT